MIGILLLLYVLSLNEFQIPTWVWAVAWGVLVLRALLALIQFTIEITEGS